MLFCFVFIFIIIIVVVIISFIIINYCFIAHVVFCILFGCSTLCWTMIQSCDYDWISIFHVMDSMYSVWGSLELASKCQKPVVSDANSVAPSPLGCAAK